MKYSLIPILAFFLIWIQKGTALNCYQCNSNEHPDCKENFDHENRDTLTIKSNECTVDSSHHCIKTTGVWGGVVGTTRFCSSRDMGNQCQFIRYPDHDRVYRACIYTCSGHSCNSGRKSVITSVWTFILTAVVSVMVYQRT